MKFPDVVNDAKLFIVNVEPELIVIDEQIAFVFALITGQKDTADGTTTFLLASGIPPHQFDKSDQFEFIPSQVELLGGMIVVIVTALESTQPVALVTITE